MQSRIPEVSCLLYSGDLSCRAVKDQIKQPQSDVNPGTAKNTDLTVQISFMPISIRLNRDTKACCVRDLVI